jgi:hypothetical protein
MDTPSDPKVNIDEYGIIHIELGSGVTDINHLRAANKKHRALSSIPGPVMIFSNAGNKISVTTEAMDYGSSKEAMEVTTAYALVTQSFIQCYLVKVLMTLHRPPRPTKIFSNKKDALEWLRTCDGVRPSSRQAN